MALFLFWNGIGKDDSVISSIFFTHFHNSQYMSHFNCVIGLNGSSIFIPREKKTQELVQAEDLLSRETMLCIYFQELPFYFWGRVTKVLHRDPDTVSHCGFHQRFHAATKSNKRFFWKKIKIIILINVNLL